MALFKCKMCGGNLNLIDGSTIAECEYCGSKQTVPTADSEKKMSLFVRANRLRASNEFDKAAGVYESIVADFPEEAEAYWGLVLCKFGIEYVDDPATGKKIPTCHRSGFDSVMDDKDFELVMEYADPIARKLYREEAKQIEELRKAIIEVSGKEEPYDIFICYKETADDGQRTIDSVLAQDIYEKLTDAGYRVFFSRITLEDKLGTEYEPYIFAALNSAKLMLAFGTDYDYYNAVWVKNEWSRFLKLMEKDKSKRLIPCYRDIDAYDMPKEFAKLQAQDMSKVGADQDLVRAIKKLLPLEVEKVSQVVQQTVHQLANGNLSIDPLIKRAYLFLEDADWASADLYSERVLDMDPENAEGYMVKLLVNFKIKTEEDISKVILGKAIIGEADRLIRLVSYPADKKMDAINVLARVFNFGLCEANKSIQNLPQDIAVTIDQFQLLKEIFEIDVLAIRRRGDVTTDSNYLKFIRFAPFQRAERVKQIVRKGNELLAENNRMRAETEAEHRRAEAVRKKAE